MRKGGPSRDGSPFWFQRPFIEAGHPGPVKVSALPQIRPQGPPSARPPASVDAFSPSSKDQEPLKIWLVHGSYTGGHASAARSLEKALSSHPGVTVEVLNQADSSSSPLPMSTAAEKALVGGRVANAVRRWWFDQNFEGNRFTGWATDQAMALEGLFSGALLERLQEEKPDLVVSTMSASTALLSHWKEQGRFEAPLETVVTDFACHQVWEQEGVDRYYVAHETTKADLERFGADPARVEVTGIPIGPAFAGPARDRAEVKAALGLDPTRPLVLVLGGSQGFGGFERTVEALDGLPEEFQVAVIAGRNEEARQQVAARSWSHPVRAEGFTQAMPDWIEAADLVVSKAGGLTTSEILARGRPMLIVDPHPGLEERNVTRLTAAGVARSVSGPAGLADEVGRLLRDPAEREAMEAAARQAGHPDSADAVAGMLIADAVRARVAIRDTVE